LPPHENAKTVAGSLVGWYRVNQLLFATWLEPNLG
jgi:hypothetical protein